MDFSVWISLIAILLQLSVVYQGYTLFRLVKPLKFWTKAWSLFTLSMLMIFFRRIWALMEIVFFGLHIPKGYLIEASLLLIISLLLLIFTCELKKLFQMYLNGEGVLLEREQLVEKRETVVGKRENHVQERENNQKSSGYYKSWKETGGLR